MTTGNWVVVMVSGTEEGEHVHRVYHAHGTDHATAVKVADEKSRRYRRLPVAFEVRIKGTGTEGSY